MGISIKRIPDEFLKRTQRRRLGKGFDVICLSLDEYLFHEECGMRSDK